MHTKTSTNPHYTVAECQRPFQFACTFQVRCALQVVGFPDRVAANDFMVLNANKVTAAVHLDVTAADAIGFTLQTNSTVGRHTFVGLSVDCLDLSDVAPLAPSSTQTANCCM